MPIMESSLVPRERLWALTTSKNPLKYPSKNRGLYSYIKQLTHRVLYLTYVTIISFADKFVNNWVKYDP